MWIHEASIVSDEALWSACSGDPLGPGEQEPSFITEENNCLAIFWFGYDGYLHAVRWDQDS
ncbi:hypothetical protein [Arthrobacter polaris]|uniref:hypothetical protein n=1 Tax=Arthrobacter polaris TaxID=2813727 RepID=UPI001F4366FC|nr:hypothetical protein [Arthrobacter polaris]UIK89590.1 hypothetical protein J0916_04035 [Arthrobacter polaris]